MNNQNRWSDFDTQLLANLIKNKWNAAKTVESFNDLSDMPRTAGAVWMKLGELKLQQFGKASEFVALCPARKRASRAVKQPALRTPVLVHAKIVGNDESITKLLTAHSENNISGKETLQKLTILISALPKKNFLNNTDNSISKEQMIKNLIRAQYKRKLTLGSALATIKALVFGDSLSKIN
jgi:hypothetical protein